MPRFTPFLLPLLSSLPLAAAACAPPPGAAPAAAPVVSAPSPAAVAETDRCWAMLDAGVAQVLAEPDPYRADPTLVTVTEPLLVMTLLGEVDDPRAAARLIERTRDPYAGFALAAYQVMADRGEPRWRDALRAGIAETHYRPRDAALAGLVGATDDATLDAVVASIARVHATGRIPAAEARVLAAAGARDRAGALAPVWATCEAIDLTSHADEIDLDVASACAEVAVYLHGLGEVDAATVAELVATAPIRSKARATRALGVIDPALAIPHLAAALAGTELTLAVITAAGSARRLGVADRPELIEHLRRFARMDSTWAEPVIASLPDDDPVALERLLAAIARDPEGSANLVAEVIRRGSDAADPYLIEATAGEASLDTYLAARTPLPHQLRAIPGAAVDARLEAIAAARDVPLEHRLAAALVRAQRGARDDLPVVRAVLADAAAGYHDHLPVVRALAAAACLQARAGGG